jgi:20S proteasome alpha/beta subunit
MAMTCSDGVLLAASSRVSTVTAFSLRDLSKISSITPNIYFRHSGSLSTLQVLHRKTRYYADSLAILAQDSSPPKVSVTVEVLRRLLQNVKQGLGSQLIIGGSDNNGSHFHVAVEGDLENEREIATGGSGSTYLTNYLMEYCRPGMTVDEAEEWA